MYDEAINWFKKTLELDPNYTYAKEKLIAAKKILEERKRRAEYQKYYNLAIEQLQQHKFQSAIENFNKALVYAIMEHEKIMANSKLKEAITSLNKEKQLQKYKKWYNLGIEKMRQNRFKAAIDNFNKALEFATTDYEKAITKAKIKEATVSLNKNKIRQNYWKWYNLGLERIEQRRWNEAIKNFNNALKYVSTWHEKGKIKEKIKEAKQGLNKENLRKKYLKWYNLGIKRIEQKRWQDAIENFTLAIKYATNSNEKQLAKTKLQQAKASLKEEAAFAIASLKTPPPTKPENLQKSPVKHKKSYIAWISTTASLLLIVILLLILFSHKFNLIRAKIYLLQKKYDKATHIYENAILNDKKVWLYPALANIYLKLDRIDEEAMKVYDRAVYLNPNNRKMLKILADYYIKKNRTGDRAIEIYEDTLKLDPNNTQLLNILAKAYANRGDDDKTTSIYQKLYELGQRDELIIRNLAKAYLKENRLDDTAISIYESALKYDPENQDLIIALSQAYINRGMKDKKTIEIYRKSVGLCSNLVKAYKEKNDLEKAKQYAEIAYKIVYCYSIGVVDTLIRESVMGVLNKW
jgi:tetratricopeptide (TPR) repeat protein